MPQRFFRIAFWAAIVFAAAMALHPQPPQLSIVVGDKLQHMAAFFTLGVFAALAYPRIALIRIGAALSAFGAAIEIAQLIPALNRYGDVGDWLADMAAIIAALVLVRLWRMRPDGKVENP